MGWHDVGFNNPDMIGVTENVTSLAREGLVLTNHLTHYHCSPSRRSFLSGRLPIHHGEDLSDDAGDDIDLRWSLISDKLRLLGYRTHWVGKAHTGFMSTAHLPTERGFDSYLGFLGGGQSYTSTNRWRDDGPCNVSNYSSSLFGERAVEIVSQHPVDEPLFLYLAWQAVHSPYNPVPGFDCQTTDYAPYPGVYAQMLHATDIQTGRLVQALRDRGMWSNTLLVYTSDNGGVAENGLSGNNYPLRGEKHGNWAGGYRTATFMSGGFLPSALRGTSSNLRAHIVDWYPTFCMLAGGTSETCSDDPPEAPRASWSQVPGEEVRCTNASTLDGDFRPVADAAACQSEAEAMGHSYVEFRATEGAGAQCLTLARCDVQTAGAPSRVFARDMYGAESYPGLDGVDLWPWLVNSADAPDDYAAHPTLVVSAQVILHRELKLLLGQGSAGDSGSKTRPDWAGKQPPTDGWKLANGSWVSATSVGWTCGLTWGEHAVYTPCLFDEAMDLREQRDLAPRRKADVERLWRQLNHTLLTAFHARSPAALLGHCDKTCAKQHWQSLGGDGSGPVCGVPGCGGETAVLADAVFNV